MTRDEIDLLGERIIGLAIEVHRSLGPGLLESLYESALCIELENAGLRFERQKKLPIVYKGRSLGDFRMDLIVENAVLLEVKSVERHDTVFEAQVISYLKISGLRLGYLMNFNTRLLKDGLKRLILSPPNA